ncbi:Zn-dependent exopeptidase [Gonapodya prolifera JEL478]|uniref:Peptide hydrolase n=1 Tax=Gonapodya prolifera (strain JEL478) TaxID=1344416 RepID=A0A139AK70_GONPJ|nr:Zn-dependent exopeptidase [Gonapodya prolifera JEL478]|eukprot:KXS16903.1 Zn-dependent exopeptidase [Gonapodya prolifera JEL478]
MRRVALLAILSVFFFATVKSWPTTHPSLLDLSDSSADDRELIAQPPVWVEPWGPRLIQLEDGAAPISMTEEEILDLIRAKRKFMDVTQWPSDIEVSVWKSPSGISPASKDTPKLRYQPILKGVFSNISEDACRTFLTKFSSFPTRYFRSQSGVDSAKWLLSEITKLADSTIEQRIREGHRPIEKAQDEDKGSSTGATQPIVVVSAHQDSINQWNPWFGRAPGADDDGSGSTTLHEAFSVYTKAGLVPEIPIEFHWYAGEEGGLLGSQTVVSAYKKKGVAVRGVLHIDMAGWTGEANGKKEVIGIGQDFVDPSLTKFMESLVDEYLTIPHVTTECGYACSDHASWTKAGYPAVFPFESTFKDSNPYIHTTKDSIEQISFSHIAQHVRLVLSFLVELGGLTES